ncbi:MAG: CBS domain-containing protein [Pyrinomonadaceae bacterium]|nr:CBS domain-containing protein [Pyrinomonadaceae bacterium]
MSRHRDDRDDEYYGRRGGRPSHAEERFNESQRENQDRSRDPRGPQFNYDNSSVRDRPRPGSNPREYDDYGRDRYDNRQGYTNPSGSAQSGYERDDYGRARYTEDQGEHTNRPQAYRSRGAARSHVKCRDIMTRDVTVATRDMTLQQVAVMMRNEDTGVIPVVERAAETTTNASSSGEARRGSEGNSYGRLVGLITDRDIVVRAIAEGKDANTTRAEEIMTEDVHTAQPNDRVIDAIRKMGDKQVRRIPVVDRDNNLRGIISMADVALETEADQELAHALEEISSGASFWSKMFG